MPPLPHAAIALLLRFGTTAQQASLFKYATLQSAVQHLEGEIARAAPGLGLELLLADSTYRVARRLLQLNGAPVPAPSTLTGFSPTSQSLGALNDVAARVQSLPQAAQVLELHSNLVSLAKRVEVAAQNARSAGLLGEQTQAHAALASALGPALEAYNGDLASVTQHVATPASTAAASIVVVYREDRPRVGSGVFFRGKSLVTAAHVLYADGDDSPPDAGAVKVVTTTGTLVAGAIQIHPRWLGGFDLDADIAVVDVPDAPEGIGIAIGVMSTTPGLCLRQGQPLDVGAQASATGTIWRAGSFIYSNDLDVPDGMSGGALLSLRSHRLLGITTRYRPDDQLIGLPMTNGALAELALNR